MTAGAETAARPRLQGLALALLLGIALALLSYVRRVGDMDSAMFHHGVMDALVAGRFWGTALARNVLLFVAALSGAVFCSRSRVASQLPPLAGAYTQ